MSDNLLVLDANILIRAVLGVKVRDILIEYCDAVDFFTPDVCIDDAKKYLPIIATALTMNCWVWTEDQDFFGTGISMTSDTRFL